VRDRREFGSIQSSRSWHSSGKLSIAIACYSEDLIAMLLFDPSMSALPSHRLGVGILTLRLSTLARVDISHPR
jgi:hypothetical protein